MNPIPDIQKEVEQTAQSQLSHHETMMKVYYQKWIAELEATIASEFAGLRAEIDQREERLNATIGIIKALVDFHTNTTGGEPDER